MVVEKGTIVTEVMNDSPASRSGLRKGDLLFSIGNRPIGSALELMSRVRHSAPGGVIELGVIRHNRPYLIRLNVGQRRLSPVGNFSAGQLTLDPKAHTRDSIYREVERLKRSLIRLENRLRNLGP